MKYTQKILLACLVCFTLTSCFRDNVVTPSSKTSSEFYDLDGYTKLDVNDNFKVFVGIGDQEEIEILANDNLHNYINVSVSGNTLRIRTDDVSIWGDETLEAYITTTNLDNYRISGNSKVEILDEMINEELTLRLSGNSKFYGEVDLERMDADASGNSKIELEGFATASDIVLSGNSKFEDFDYETNILDARLAGNSKAYLTIQEGIYYRGSGNSKLYYRGDAIIESEDLSGNSKLIRD